MNAQVPIREGTLKDWPAIWRFMRQIVVAGETFSWKRDISEEEARERWMHEPPGRTFVAVAASGMIVGTAESEPNHEGPAAHVATASFMVDPEHQGRGIGRALCEQVLESARADGYHSMQFNAVVETNTPALALWRSLGFEILATVPEAFHHPTAGYVGLHVMYRRLATTSEADGSASQEATAKMSERLARLRPYLVEPRCAVLSTLGRDGSPHPAVVHYQLEGDAIVINGRVDRRWSRNLRRDPRVSLVIPDAGEPLHWVGIRGTAELLREGPAAVEDAMAIARRYDEDPSAYREQERVSFRIVPLHVHEYAA